MWVLVPATLSGLWIVSIASSLSSWDSATSTTANTPREPQHASAISRQTRDPPSDIARLGRSHRNDDVGSHDLPSAAPFDCLRLLALLAVAAVVRPAHRFAKDWFVRQWGTREMRVARQVALNGSELLPSAATQKFEKRQLQKAPIESPLIPRALPAGFPH